LNEQKVEILLTKFTNHEEEKEKTDRLADDKERSETSTIEDMDITELEKNLEGMKNPF